MYIGALKGDLSTSIRGTSAAGSNTATNNYWVGWNGSNTTFAGSILENIVPSPNNKRWVGIVKTGSGTWTLAGTNNSYFGPTIISNGVLVLSGRAAASTGSTFWVNSDNSLIFSNDTVFGLGGLQSTGNVGSVVLANTDGMGIALTIGGNNFSQTYGGNLSGAGSLTKIGSGAQTLTGSNTYTGGTTVSNGTLLVNSTVGSGTGAGAVAVVSGATLGGCGTISGNMVVDSGGTVLANCGSTLNFSSMVTNNGNVVAVNGTTVDFYGPVVNYGMIDGTGGGILFHSTLQNNGTVTGVTNSWIDGSGKWETATNWWLGTAPSSNDAANLITNAGYNTVTIDAITTSNFPSTLAIKNLTVSAPGFSNNTLFLDNAGTSTPLRILGVLLLGTNGAMVVNNSAVQATNSVSIGNSSASSSLVVSNGGSLIVTNGSGTGSVVVNGGSLILGVGTFKTDNLVVTNGGMVQHEQTYQVDNATVTVAGGSEQAGSNLVAGSSANSTGIVTVTDGGQLVVTNGVVGIGNNGTITSGGGVGLMTVSNGTLLASTILLGSTAGGHGDLIIQSNGVVNFDNCPGGTNCALVANDIAINGGALFITNGTAYCGRLNPGAMTVSNGAASCLLFYAGYDNAGTLTMLNGQINVSSGLTVGNLGSPISTGQVWISGGELDSTNAGVISVVGNSGVGGLTISNGLARFASLWIANSSNPGTVTLAGGSLVTGNLQLTRTTGQFLFTGGTFATQATSVTNGLPFTVGDGINPATMTLQGGVHSFCQRPDYFRQRVSDRLRHHQRLRAGQSGRHGADRLRRHIHVRGHR